jgi:hypothetical protein
MSVWSKAAAKWDSLMILPLCRWVGVGVGVKVGVGVGVGVWV